MNLKKMIKYSALGLKLGRLEQPNHSLTKKKTAS